MVLTKTKINLIVPLTQRTLLDILEYITGALREGNHLLFDALDLYKR